MNEVFQNLYLINSSIYDEINKKLFSLKVNFFNKIYFNCLLKKDIATRFKKQLDNNLKLLSREMIKNAVMMFIVRYLGGMRQEVDIGNDDLIIRLENREDIWDKEIFNNEQFKNEIEKFIPSRIKIRNIKSFYNTIAKEEQPKEQNQIRRKKIN